MTQEPERRHRRRGFWWLLAVPVALVVLAGTAYAVVQVTSSPNLQGSGPAQPKSTASSSAIVSAPLATGTGQATSGNGNGTGGGGAGSISAGTTSTGTTASNGNGNANGQANGKSLTVAFVSATPLFPGGSGTLTLRVDNSNQQDVLLTSVTSTVTSVTSGTRPGIPSCNKSWFQIGGLTGAPVVGGRSSRTITVPVTMVDTANVNQDNCKGVTYQFSFTVNGRQA